jgi:hypothetical protein
VDKPTQVCKFCQQEVTGEVAISGGAGFVKEGGPLPRTYRTRTDSSVQDLGRTVRMMMTACGIGLFKIRSTRRTAEGLKTCRQNADNTTGASCRPPRSLVGL